MLVQLRRLWLPILGECAVNINNLSPQVVELVRAPYFISLDAGTVLGDSIVDHSKPGSTAWGTQQIIWQSNAAVDAGSIHA